MATKTKFTNTDCTKSVTITATCPPLNTKYSEMLSKMTMMRGNVGTLSPSTSKRHGRPQK